MGCRFYFCHNIPKNTNTLRDTQTPVIFKERIPIGKFMWQWNSSHLFGLWIRFHCYFPLIRIIFHLSARPTITKKKWQTRTRNEKYSLSLSLWCLGWLFVFVCVFLFHLSRHRATHNLAPISFQTLIYNNSPAFVIRTRIYISHGNSL